MFKEKYKIIIVLSFVFFVGSIIFSPQVLFAQKILAFSRTLPGATMEKMGPHFKAEAAKAWELYTKGILREMYFRTDRPESVLILECDNTDEANVDSKRHGLATITTPHDAVHDGIMFEISYIFASVTAGGGTADILIINGSSKELHITMHVVSGAEAYMYLYENPTVTTVGTSLPIHDMNRTTFNSPVSTTAYHTPTIAAVGTLLSQSLIEGGTAGRAIGGQVRWGTEWILRRCLPGPWNALVDSIFWSTMPVSSKMGRLTSCPPRPGIKSLPPTCGRLSCAPGPLSAS